MKTRVKYLMTAWFSICIILIMLIALQGCRTTEPRNEAVTMVKPKDQISRSQEQTLCPIMGLAVDKSVYTEYQGKEVYFCCAGCINKFKENPEQYVSKLPQFNR